MKLKLKLFENFDQKNHSFEEIRDMIDEFVFSDPGLVEKKWQYLWNTYGEDLAGSIGNAVEAADEDESDEEGLYAPWLESTLKHQVFDYWDMLLSDDDRKVDKGSRSNKAAERYYKDHNDVAGAIAADFADTEPNNDMVDDLKNLIINYK